MVARLRKQLERLEVVHFADTQMDGEAGVTVLLSLGCPRDLTSFVKVYEDGRGEPTPQGPYLRQYLCAD